MHVVVPASIPGADPVVQVRIVNDDGQGSNELPFTYLFPAPSITSLDPVSAQSGEPVEITGLGLRDGLSVFFGDVPASVVAFSETGATPGRITVTAPALAPGSPAAVAVRVENVDDQSSNELAFTYLFPAPVVTLIDPVSALSGTDIDVIGTSFRDGLRVFVGAVEAAVVTFSETGLNPDRITITVPPATLGGPDTASVTVVNVDGQISNGVTFTYLFPGLTIDSLEPNSSLVGVSIEILGTGIRDGVRVFFGSTESEEVTYDQSGPRPNTIFARVPQGTGVVSVYVVNPDDQESGRLTFVILAALVDFVRGDANRDGDTDVADGVTVLLYLFQGGAITCEDAADVDDNEEVDITDAIYLLNYLFGGGPPPRAPFPAAGEDPAGEVLGCEA